MTYQQFDEKLQSLSELTPERRQKIRTRWQKVSRLGLPLYALTRGSILFVWICLCYVGFMDLYGAQRLLHDSFVIKSTALYADFKLTLSRSARLDGPVSDTAH